MTSKTAKHTETPWKEGPRYGNQGIEITSGDGRKVLGMFYAYKQTESKATAEQKGEEFDPEGLANLRHALTACNTFDALAGAARGFIDAVFTAKHSGGSLDAIQQRGWAIMFKDALEGKSS